MRAYTAHVCVRVCARPCACVFGRTRIRAETCGPFPSASPRVARFAGASQHGVQRRHRCVEHCACHLVARGMRRSRPGPSGRALRRTRSAGARCGTAVVRGGTADAISCAHTYRYSVARVFHECIHSCG